MEKIEPKKPDTNPKTCQKPLVFYLHRTQWVARGQR